MKVFGSGKCRLNMTTSELWGYGHKISGGYLGSFGTRGLLDGAYVDWSCSAT